MVSETILAILSGGVIGVLLGATGGGGSLIAIPLLVYVVGIPVRHATAMSLIVVGYTALFGAWQESRRGNVKGVVALAFSATGMVGAWLGAQAHQLVPDHVILLLFGSLLVSISLWALWPKHGSVTDTRDIECAENFSAPCALKSTTIGFCVGMLTGFFGIGGGFVIVPALMFVLGFPIRMAIGTSFLIIALTSVGGIIGHLDMQQLDLTLTGTVICGSVLGMVAGTRVARTMDEQRLRTTFSILVGLTGALLVIDNSMRLLQ